MIAFLLHASHAVSAWIDLNPDETLALVFTFCVAFCLGMIAAPSRVRLD